MSWMTLDVFKGNKKDARWVSNCLDFFGWPLMSWMTLDVFKRNKKDARWVSDCLDFTGWPSMSLDVPWCIKMKQKIYQMGVKLLGFLWMTLDVWKWNRMVFNSQDDLGCQFSGLIWLFWGWMYLDCLDALMLIWLVKNYHKKTAWNIKNWGKIGQK